MRNKNNNHHSTGKGEVRIIGGQWRSRKLKFADVDGLRPSTDRVRETVFNWLQFDLPNSRCLDVCAGSGALGFEALSRNARAVHFVELESIAIKMIKDNAQALGVTGEQAVIHQSDILSFLNGRNSQEAFSVKALSEESIAEKTVNQEAFDIVFVDPPFAKNMHSEIFTALIESNSLSENALIYCEMPSTETIELPQSWTWHRQKSFKNVSFGLIAV